MLFNQRFLIFTTTSECPVQDLTCAQCGTCCRKGGPLLHEEDLLLITESHISLEHLVTVRMGEWAQDPTQNAVRPLEVEVIKIAGTQESAYPWHCVLHGAQGCALHPRRPAQCRALFCQNSSALEAMYGHNRLTRHDILQHMHHKDRSHKYSNLGGWPELVRAHEQECSVRTLSQLLQQQSHDEVWHMIRYDEHFRALCMEKAQIPKNVLPFLFGRPLMRIVHGIRQAQGQSAQAAF